MKVVHLVTMCICKLHLQVCEGTSADILYWMKHSQSIPTQAIHLPRGMNRSQHRQTLAEPLCHFIENAKCFCNVKCSLFYLKLHNEQRFGFLRWTRGLCCFPKLLLGRISGDKEVHLKKQWIHGKHISGKNDTDQISFVSNKTFHLWTDIAFECALQNLLRSNISQARVSATVAEIKC